MYNNKSRQSQMVERAKAHKELHAKLEAEAQRKKLEKTEANFPSLGGGNGAQTSMKFGTSFSSLATQWKEEEERQKIVGARRPREEDEIQGVFMRYGRRARVSRVEEDDGEYYDQDGYEGTDSHGFVLPPKVDSEGWEEVRHKRMKPKRELTSRELEEKYALDNDDDEDNEEVDHNGELFDTNRHDHH